MVMTKQMYQNEQFLYNSKAIDCQNYLGYLISYNGKTQPLVEDRKVANMGIQAIRTNRSVSTTLAWTLFDK